MSNPHYVDTDGDGLDDGEEFALLEEHPCLDLAEPDSDGDYLTDFDEIRGVFGFATNPCAADSDGDGIFDLAEVFEGTNPVDSSERGTDSDGDGLADLLENEGAGLILGRFPWDGPYESGCADMDGDGLLDGEELLSFVPTRYTGIQTKMVLSTAMKSTSDLNPSFSIPMAMVWAMDWSSV